MTVRAKVDGLQEFRRELRQLGTGLQKELTPIHRRAANLVGDRARAAAPTRLRGAIRDRATQRAAMISTVDRPPDAIARIWGAKRRTGWYAAGRYANSAGRQFEPWVGNQWDPGAFGGAPYFIGPAINDSIDEVIEIIGDGYEELAAKAFPEGR